MQTEACYYLIIFGPNVVAFLQAQVGSAKRLFTVANYFSNVLRLSTIPGC